MSESNGRIISDQQRLTAQVLVDRLGRLSADSVWAHRASGVRASIDKFLEVAGQDGEADSHHLADLLTLGFEIIEKAAQEIPDESTKTPPTTG